MTTGKTASAAALQVLTETKAPSMQARRVNIATWAEWFQWQTLNDLQLEKMLSAAANFVLDIREGIEPAWLVLIGTSGAGKTHLAKRVWRWWDKCGKWFVEPTTGANCVQRGQFCLWADFIDECRSRDFSRTKGLMEDDLVIIDDIGAGADARGWMADKLYHIIERRLDAKRATLITANLSLEQLAEAYDQRIASRLVRCGVERVIQVEVPDFLMRPK